MYYKCDKINPSCGRSYIDSPDWIKNRKVIINSNNKKGNKYFQCAVTVTLNHEDIGKNSERVTKVKPFISKYKLERINFQKKMIGKILGNIM